MGTQFLDAIIVLDLQRSGYKPGFAWPQPLALAPGFVCPQFPSIFRGNEQGAISDLLAQQFLGEGLAGPLGGCCSLSSAHSALELPKDRFCFDTSQGERGPRDLGRGGRPGSCRPICCSSCSSCSSCSPPGRFVPSNCSLCVAEAAEG